MILQHLCNSDTVPIQIPLITWLIEIQRHVSHPCLVRMKPHEKRRSCRTKTGTIVGMGKANPAFGHSIQVVGSDLGAITTKI